MSVLESPAPILVVEQGDNDAPYTYTVPASGEVEPSASVATFDGTNASGDFLAALVFRSQSGDVLMRVFPQTTVPAGDVAQVSYAPFPGGLISKSAATDALHWGVNNDTLNEGLDLQGIGSDWFFDTGGGIFDQTTSGGNWVDETSGGDYSAQTSGGLYRIDTAGGGYDLSTGSGAQAFTTDAAYTVDAGGGCELFDDSTLGLTIQQAGNSFIALNTQLSPTASTNGVFVAINTGQIFTVGVGSGAVTPVFKIGSAGLGFFGHPQSPQQATPVTLADVIALLQAYGLSA